MRTPSSCPCPRGLWGPEGLQPALAHRQAVPAPLLSGADSLAKAALPAPVCQGRPPELVGVSVQPRWLASASPSGPVLVGVRRADHAGAAARADLRRGEGAQSAGRVRFLQRAAVVAPMALPPAEGPAEARAAPWPRGSREAECLRTSHGSRGPERHTYRHLLRP